MNPLNHCALRGYLVGKVNEVPEDPGEFTPPGRPFVLGCNNLVCKNCGNQVRQGTSVYPVYAEKRDYRAIYDAKDWSTCPLLEAPTKAYQDHRLYVCPCGSELIAYYRAVDDPQEDYPLSNPWACAGHPLAVPGGTYRGLTIPEELEPAAYFPIIEATCAGETPEFVSPEDTTPPIGAMLQRLYRRLHDTRMAEVLSLAVAESLTHPDFWIRARALRFFYSMPGAPGHERLYHLARMTDRTPFERSMNPFPSSPKRHLFDWLIGALGERLYEGDRDPLLLELLRYEALHKDRAAPVLTGLAHGDTDWLVEHAEEIVTASPDVALELLRRVDQAGGDVVRAGLLVVRAEGVDKAALAKGVRKYFAGPVCKRLLKALEGSQR